MCVVEGKNRSENFGMIICRPADWTLPVQLYYLWGRITYGDDIAQPTTTKTAPRASLSARVDSKFRDPAVIRWAQM